MNWKRNEQARSLHAILNKREIGIRVLSFEGDILKQARWVSHRELLKLSGEIKKAERKIMYVMLDIEAVLSPSSVRFGGRGGSSRISDPTANAALRLDGLYEKLKARQDHKLCLQERFEELLSDVQSPVYDTLCLYYLERLSVTDISIKENLSEGTVKNRLRVGRDLVYEKIKQVQRMEN